MQFHNTGPSWIPGVVVMSIEDGYEGVPGLTQMDEWCVRTKFVNFLSSTILCFNAILVVHISF